MKKTPKSRPLPPEEAAHWSKDEIAKDVIRSIQFELGISTSSEILPRQLEACVAGLRDAERLLERMRGDEWAQKYQQIEDHYLNDAKSLISDSLQIFFVACQVYVTRFVETVRWLKVYEDGRCQLGGQYDRDYDVRHIGPQVAGQMTIAECVWCLGNYAKHNPELRGLSDGTKESLRQLNVLNSTEIGEVDAVGRIAGRSIDSFSVLEECVREMTRRLTAWMEHVGDEMIADLDEYRCGDRTRTKREVAEIAAIFGVFNKEPKGEPS